MDYLDPGELARIESEFARGLSAGAIVEIFRPKGVRLSEATFRKYVQAGLLPRSRRVGRKGKHRGSHGLYPVESVRRINAIKKMMAAGLTLEEIRRSFVGVKNHIDQVERSLDETLSGLESELTERTLATQQKRNRSRASSAGCAAAPGTWCATCRGSAARSPRSARSARSSGAISS